MHVALKIYSITPSKKTNDPAFFQFLRFTTSNTREEVEKVRPL